MIVFYIFVAAYVMSFVVIIVLRVKKCYKCPYKYPGCKIETVITSATECYADRHHTKKEKEELLRKIDELFG